MKLINRNRNSLSRFAGASAIVGGASWVAKGGVIMLGGDQPPVLFEVGPPFFVIGLLGLRARIPGGGRETKLGGLLAYAGGALLVLTGILYAQGLELSEESFDVGNAVVLASSLAIIGSLVLLGVGTRRARSLAPSWNALPLAMGLSIVPMMMVGGLLESMGESLFELPIVLFGSAWVVLGYLMWSTPARRAG